MPLLGPRRNTAKTRMLSDMRNGHYALGHIPNIRARNMFSRFLRKAENGHGGRFGDNRPFFSLKESAS